MSKSIMQKKDGSCYLCKLSGKDWQQYTEEHHVMFGTSDRRLSERYGLKVYLCPEHHRFGSDAVHMNKGNDLILRRAAQEAFIKTYPDKDWMEIFGKNYL